MHTRGKTLTLSGLLLALIVAAAVGFWVLLTVPAPVERWLQERILLALREHYQSDVKLENLRVTLVPAFHATADNFTLPNRGDGNLPPLIKVKHLTVEAGVFELLRSPIHVSWAKLVGLEIAVPPKHDAISVQKPKHHTHLANFVIDKVDADGTELYVLRKDPTKEPMNFDLRHLTLGSAGIGQPMTFRAQLSNPTPPGFIETTGRFGPLNMDEPSSTKVSGHYVFQHADLSVFNGLSGMLSSTGDYAGILHNLVVDGTTDVPAFQLDRGGRSVHLTTEFHASVDGTNGNTYLHPVTAHFLKSNVTTNGEVASNPGQKGKTIALDIDMHDALVQDVLALASKSAPAALTGRLKLQAKLTLPPSKQPVLQKILMNGRFALSEARFSGNSAGNAIAELSRRAQGKPDDHSIGNVAAELVGNFDLRNTTLSFSDFQFVVPGAIVQMKGSYGLHSEELDFVGDVRLHARISQTMTGPSRWMLVPFDPIFMKHGAGTYLPVGVSGTREHPQIKVDWKKVF